MTDSSINTSLVGEASSRAPDRLELFGCKRCPRRAAIVNEGRMTRITFSAAIACASSRLRAIWDFGHSRQSHSSVPDSSRSSHVDSGREAAMSLHAVFLEYALRTRSSAC